MEQVLESGRDKPSQLKFRYGILALARGDIERHPIRTLRYKEFRSVDGHDREGLIADAFDLSYRAKRANLLSRLRKCLRKGVAAEKSHNRTGLADSAHRSEIAEGTILANVLDAGFRCPPDGD